MFFHDSVADAQSEASPFTDLLGSEERIENPVRLADSGAVVPERDFYEIGATRCRYFDPRTLHGFADRVIRIIQDVEEHLLQLMRVANHEWQMVLQALGNGDAAALQVIRTQLNGAFQNRIQLHRLSLRRHLASEAQQVLHDLLRALRLLQDDAQIFACAFRQLGVLHQQVCETQDRRERIVHFMGDAGN